jgi:hypothetical protein
MTLRLVCRLSGLQGDVSGKTANTNDDMGLSLFQGCVKTTRRPCPACLFVGAYIAPVLASQGKVVVRHQSHCGQNVKLAVVGPIGMNDMYNEIREAQHPFITVSLCVERDGIVVVNFYDRFAAMASYVDVRLRSDGRLELEGRHEHVDAEGFDVDIVGGTVDDFVNSCYTKQLVKIAGRNIRLAAVNA